MDGSSLLSLTVGGREAPQGAIYNPVMFLQEKGGNSDFCFKHTFYIVH